LSPAGALDPAVAQCNATFTDCAIPENTPLNLPFLAISGDVAVVPNLHANLNAISDDFRIANNFIDTGAGTGLGFSALLFSGEHSVPDPSTFSANAVGERHRLSSAHCGDAGSRGRESCGTWAHGRARS
jgi:hypothetical protein